MPRSRDDGRVTRRTVLRLLGGAMGVAALGTTIGCAPASQPAAPATQQAAPAAQQAKPAGQQAPAPTQPAGQQAPAQAQPTIKLKFAHSLPANLPLVAIYYVGIMEKVTARTNGRVTWEHYPGEQFGKATDLPDMTRAGTIDVTTYATSYTASKFPLSTMVELPGLHQDPVAATRAGNEVTMKYLAEGYIKNLGVRPLATIISMPAELLSRKPIQKLADLKGMKIGSTSLGAQEALKLLGAVPVAIIHTENYESMSRGVVDAVTGTYSSFITYSLGEVAKYATQGARLGTTSGLVAASEKTWQKLPEDVRNILAQASVEEMLRYEEAVIPDAVKDLEQAKSKWGIVVNTLPPEERELWAQTITPLYDRWVQDKEKEGHQNAREVFNAYRQLVQKYEAERGAGKKQ